MKWWSWLIIAISGVITWWALLIFAAYLLNFVVSWEIFIEGIVAICGLALVVSFIRRNRDRN